MSALQVVGRDLDEWTDWIAADIARLEDYLAAHAEFTRRYGP